MSPIGWAIRPLQKFATFSGRASRAEFWWFCLFVVVLYVGMMFIAVRSFGGMTPAQASDPATAINFANSAAGILMSVMGLLWLVLLIPMIAVQVRRLHDTNRSGWWLGAFWLLYLAYVVFMFATIFSLSANPGSAPNVAGAGLFGILALVMFVYSIVLLVLFCLPGTHGPNRFGEDPYGTPVEEVFA